MGKKRSKKKGTKPPDPRTLPFLQEMFPNIEKDIVEIVYEQNEYDEEKTMQLLTEMSSDDGSKLYDEFLDENNSLDDAVDSFSNIELGSSSNQHNSNGFYTHSPTHSPPKIEPFISTYDTSSFSSKSNAKNNKRLSAQKPSAPIPYDDTFLTTIKPTSSSSIRSPKMASSTTGEAGQFLSSMFPELDPTMVSLLYEENGSDVGKTVESLLSIVFMNHSGAANEDEAEALDEVESEALAEVADEAEDGEYHDFEGESDEALDEEKGGDSDEAFESEEVEIEEDGEYMEEDEEGGEEENSCQLHFDTGDFKVSFSQLHDKLGCTNVYSSLLSHSQLSSKVKLF